MGKDEIVKTFLEITFGKEPKRSLKEFVNLALDRGEYWEGFEIAIKKSELDYQEYEELLDSFNKAYGNNFPDESTIREIVEAKLPQAYFSKLSWLVSESGEIYATDGLRVIKVFENKLVWETPRVSWDGINLSHLGNDKVHGQWYSPINEDSPWNTLVLSAKDGTLREEEIIEH